MDACSRAPLKLYEAYKVFSATRGTTRSFGIFVGKPDYISYNPRAVTALHRPVLVLRSSPAPHLRSGPSSLQISRVEWLMR